MIPKTVHCIRHGQSTFNAIHDGVTDPLHWDAPLSALGREQAAGAAARVRHVPYELVVTSPLTRALQTTMAIFGDHPAAPAIRVEGLHREHLSNSCDVGRAVSILRGEFPHYAFDHLDEEWWHRDGEADERGLVVEPDHVLAARVGEFRAWLEARPERLIAVVGHGMFFFHLTGQMLKNCDIAALEWR